MKTFLLRPFAEPALSKERSFDKLRMTRKVSPTSVILSPTSVILSSAKNLVFVLLIFCIGCATAAIETKGKDAAGGATCKATYTSAFKSFTDIQLKACGAEGGAGTANIDPQAAILMDVLLKALMAKAAPAAVPILGPTAVTP